MTDPKPADCRRAIGALGAVLVVFGLHAALALSVVPPWQQPDEPQHFEFASLLSTQARLDLGQRADEHVQRDILASMASHGWWSYLGLPTPAPVPLRFADAHPLNLTTQGGVPTAPPLYYLAASSALRWTGAAGVEAQLTVLRGLSMALGGLTLVAVWAGGRRALGDVGAAWVAGCLALLPQFALTSIAANPDVAANLLGALLWWLVMRVWTERRIAPALVSASGALLVAGVAAFSKGTGLPVAAAGVSAAVAGVVFVLPGWRMRLTAFAVLLALGAAASLLAFRIAPAEVGRLIDYALAAVSRSALPPGAAGISAADFVLGLFDSAWLTAGWLSVPAPEGWRQAARLLVAVGAMLGLASWWVVGRRPSVDTGLAVWFVGLQVAGIALSTYAHGMGAQGRYLFPVAAPAAVLAWRLVTAGGTWTRWPPLAALVFLALFGCAGWASTLVPTFVGGPGLVH